eukprot:3548664-Alexandrium_andersonii.AAC.1
MVALASIPELGGNGWPDAREGTWTGGGRGAARSAERGMKQTKPTTTQRSCAMLPPRLPERPGAQQQ